METLASILWQIWRARNGFIFQREGLRPSRVAEAALADSHVARLTASSLTNKGRSLLSRGTLWKPPDPGIDGFSKHFAASSALQAEIQAVSLSLQHLQRHGLSGASLLLELDSLLVVEILNRHRKPPWEAQPLFLKAASLLSCFPNLSLGHCRREANIAADWAAKAHDHSSFVQCWAVFPPFYLIDLICADALAAGCNDFTSPI